MPSGVIDVDNCGGGHPATAPDGLSSDIKPHQTLLLNIATLLSNGPVEHYYNSLIVINRLSSIPLRGEDMILNCYLSSSTSVVTTGS